MRKLAQALDVVPMALYRHVANKDELLDGMVDVVIGEIDPPLEGADWKTAIRATDPLRPARAPPPSVGVSTDGVADHPHAGRARLHGLDDRAVPHRRLLARSHPPRPARDGQPDVRLHPGAVQRHLVVDPEMDEEMFGAMADTFPYIFEIFTTISHDDRSVVGAGCDDQFEFEFALDLMLNGLEELKDAV